MSGGTSRKNYPLDRLLDLRERKVEEQAAELARAIQGRERAAEQRNAAEIACRRAADAAEDQRVLEREALVRGELTVADLLRGSTWEMGVQLEAAELCRRVEQAASEERSAVEAEARSRAELAQRKADADVIEKDRARYLDEEKKRIEAKEEESAGERASWRRG